MSWLYIYLGGLVISALIAVVFLQIDLYQHRDDVHYDVSDQNGWLFPVCLFWPIVAPVVVIILVVYGIYAGIGKIVFYLMDKFSSTVEIDTSTANRNSETEEVEVVSISGVTAVVRSPAKKSKKKLNKKEKNELIKNQIEVKEKEELF